jgi:hypothetical protein
MPAPNPPQPAIVRCQDCRFWHAFGRDVGSCRRYAPPPSQHADDTGFWPETLAVNACGEGVAKTAGDGAASVSCGDCAFWFRYNPDQGLIPLRRGDLPADWWRDAGYCIRLAPRAEYQWEWRSVTRAHWRATHVGDRCGEAVQRVSSAAPAED